MTRAQRLAKLEADTLERWHKAWERSAVAFDRHMRGVSINAADLRQGLETELPHLSDDEVENACREFLLSINVTQFDGFSLWFKSYELPDPDATRPDLSMWPCDVPEPPDELPGEWDTGLPYSTSDDLIERLAAQVYLFILASARTARAIREEHAVTLSDSR